MMTATTTPKRGARFTRRKGGCLACKGQKRKCDQLRPQCQRCLHQGKPCSYLAPPDAGVSIDEEQYAERSGGGEQQADKDGNENENVDSRDTHSHAVQTILPIFPSHLVSQNHADWVSDLHGLWTGSCNPGRQIPHQDAMHMSDATIAASTSLLPSSHIFSETHQTLSANEPMCVEYSNVAPLPSDLAEAWSVLAAPGSDMWSWLSDQSEPDILANTFHQQQNLSQNGMFSEQASTSSLFGPQSVDLSKQGSHQAMMQIKLDTLAQAVPVSSEMLPPSCSLPMAITLASTQPHRVSSTSTVATQTGSGTQPGSFSACHNQQVFAANMRTAFVSPETSTSLHQHHDLIIKDRTFSILQKMLESVPRADEPHESDLIYYYDNVVNHTVVALESGNGRLKSSDQMYSVIDGASPMAVTIKSALRDAVLCVAAMHRYSTFTVLREQDESVSVGPALVSARQRRKAAISSLKYLHGIDDLEERQILASAIILVLLSCIMEGDGKLFPPLLKVADSFIHPVNTDYTSVGVLCIYRTYNALCRGEAWSLPRPSVPTDRWLRGVDAAVKDVIGISLTMLRLSAEVISLVNGWDRLGSEMCLSSPDSSTWDEIEIKGQCDAIEAQLIEDHSPEDTDLDVRVYRGNQCQRVAMRIMLLKEVFHLPATDQRIQACLRIFLRCAEPVPACEAIGLMWPALICGAEALDGTRVEIRNLTRKWRWQGTASARLAEQILAKVWKDRDTGQDTSWRTVVRDFGHPLLV